MTVRCKLKLTEIRSYAYGKNKTFVFQAEYDTSIPEDQRFAKATPNARFEIMVDNPTVIESYKIGEYYYFDSIPVSIPTTV